MDAAINREERENLGNFVGSYERGLGKHDIGDYNFQPVDGSAPLLVPAAFQNFPTSNRETERKRERERESKLGAGIESHKFPSNHPICSKQQNRITFALGSQSFCAPAFQPKDPVTGPFTSDPGRDRISITSIPEETNACSTKKRKRKGGEPV